MSTEPDDASLALRWQQGEKAAGELLYRRYFPTVLNYFRNKVGDAERGDLVADTFLRGQRGLQTFRGDASFKTFILKIAHNTLVDHYRRRANERKHADARDRELSAQDLARSPFSLIADSQQARLLLEALRRLPHELQELLELRFWEELTGPEIAEVLGIPEGTVRSRLSAAKERLERGLAELASSPDLLASTLSDLDGWARKLRTQMGRQDDP